MSSRSLIDSLTTVSLDHRGLVDAIALHMLDSQASLAGGLDTSEGQAIAAFYAHGGKSRTVAGMAAVIRFTECDDIHAPSCVSPGCIAIPTALEFAQSDRCLVNAIEAGYATGLAFAMSVGGISALDYGVWPTLFAAPAIAAVTSAVARNLEPQQVIHALLIAMSGVSGRLGRPVGQPSGRWLAIGEATLKGIRATYSAQQGFKGDPDLFSPEWLRTQTEPNLASSQHLDRLPHESVKQVGLKPYVAARQGANAIKAFQSLIDKGLPIEDILSVEVILPAAAIPVVSRPLDQNNRLSTIANLGLQLGIVIYERDRLLDISRDKPFRSETLAFVDKVQIMSDNKKQGEISNTWVATIRIHTTNKIYVETCQSLTGDSYSDTQFQLVAHKASHFIGADIMRLFDQSKLRKQNFLFRANKDLHLLLKERFERDGSQPQKLPD